MVYPRCADGRLGKPEYMDEISQGPLFVAGGIRQYPVRSVAGNESGWILSENLALLQSGTILFLTP